MEVLPADYPNFHVVTPDRSPNQSPLRASPSPERHSPRGSLEQSLHIIVEPQLDGHTNLIHLMNPPTGQILSSLVAEHGAHIEIQPGVFFRVPFPHEHGYSYPAVAPPMHQPHGYHQHYPINNIPSNIVTENESNVLIPSQQYNPSCPVHCHTVNNDIRGETLLKVQDKHGKCTCLKYQNGPVHPDFLLNKDSPPQENMFNQSNGKDPSQDANGSEEDISLCMPPKARALSPYAIVIAWDECVSNNSHLSSCQFDLQISVKGNNFKTLFRGKETCFTVRDLSPGTEYHFRLCAILNKKNGPFSEIVPCRTPCTVPAWPTAPMVTHNTKSSITLKWAAPADGGSPITHYKLQWRKSKNDQFNELFVGLQRQFRHSHALPPGTMCIYRLQASNELGDSEYSPNLECLTSAGPPAAPDKPVLSECGINYIKLKWNEPDNNGSLILEYKLEMEDPSDGYGFMVQYCGQQRFYCCRNLKRNAGYKFRVKASNSHGSSKYSPTTVFSTLPEAPGKMDKPKLNGKVKSHSIPVKWDPPRDTGGDLITGYILEMDDGKGGLFNRVYHGSDREFVVGHRNPGCTYRFRVASEGKAGIGSWSPIGSFTTLPVSPKDVQPPKLSSDIKPEMKILYLEWEQPLDLGGAQIISYLVKMSKSATEEFKAVYHGPLQKCSVSDLLPGTDYYFKINASNSAGTSPWSPIASLRTAPGVPDAPSTPLVSFKSPTHIRLEWNEPQLHGTDVTVYCVEKLENEAFQKVYQGPCLFCELKRNLEPASQYYFRLQALSIAGGSPYSNVFTVETPPAPPGPVTEIKVIEQTSSSCLIQWKHPADNGSPIYEYVLEATGATSHVCTVARPKPSPSSLSTTKESIKNLHDSTCSDDHEYDVLSQEESDDDSEESDDEEAVMNSSYSESETSSSVTSRLVDDTMEYRLTGLTADASYMLRLQSVNHCGASAFSHPIQFFTKELPPPPPSLTSSSVSYHSLKLKWGDSSTSKKSLAILSHTLQMQTKSGSFTSVYSGMGTSFTLGKLKEITPYCCRVRSRNDAGDGEYSKPKIFYTSVQPPSAIKDLKVKEFCESSVTLTWSPSEKIRQDDTIEYVLQKLHSENSKEFIQIYRGTKPVYRISGLAPDQMYHFRVHAIRILSVEARNSVPSVPKESKGIFSSVCRIRTLSEKLAEENVEDDLTDIPVDDVVHKKILTDTSLAIIILFVFLGLCVIIAVLLKSMVGET